MEYWQEQQTCLVECIKNKNNGDVCVCGDGRADTPGHSAKYGTYTIMDMKTKKVIEFQLVQVIINNRNL